MNRVRCTPMDRLLINRVTPGEKLEVLHTISYSAEKETIDDGALIVELERGLARGRIRVAHGGRGSTLGLHHDCGQTDLASVNLPVRVVKIILC